MTHQKPTIVLFDMDGTTVRHVNPWLLGFLEFLDDMSYKISRVFRRGFEFKLVDDSKKTRRPRLIATRALHRVRRKSVEEIVQPCPDIYAVLDFFKTQNISMGIVSSGLGKGYGHDILSVFDLEKYFTAQIFREDSKRSKPHPDPLLRVLKNIKDPLSKNDMIWYIGDRHKDVIAALAADAALPCTLIPFSYGLNAAVAILEKGVGPDNIIINYSDFLITVKELFQK